MELPVGSDSAPDEDLTLEMTPETAHEMHERRDQLDAFKLSGDLGIDFVAFAKIVGEALLRNVSRGTSPLDELRSVKEDNERAIAVGQQPDRLPEATYVVEELMPRENAIIDRLLEAYDKR